jgi:hypothetical protein
MKKLVLYALATGAPIFGYTAFVTAQVSATDSLAIYGVQLPQDYRDWKLVSVAQENGKNNDIRAILGNDIAVAAFRERQRPFPEGSVIVRLAWRYQSSPRNDAVFPTPQSFVAGEPINVQVSVKDSGRYSTSGGWGYGQFEDGRPNSNPEVVQSCFACHSKLAANEPHADFVFTDYSK